MTTTRRTALVCVLVTAFALVVGCSNKESNTELDPTFHVASTEPGADEDAVLGDGETLEVDANPENREALQLILKGAPSPATDQPLQYELVKAIEAELYLDVDDGDGPKQWITVAEVQDADGNVLWHDRINTLYQLLRYLEVVLAQAPVPLTVDGIFTFVNMSFPQLLQFGVKVPLGIEGGVQYVLKIPNTSDGELYEAFRGNIADLQASAEPPELTGDVSTISENGHPADTIDIVILGDGYTAEERERFEKDADSIRDRFERNEPFTTRAKQFNFHTVFTPSNESGAGYDCTGIITADRGCKRDLRDTPFEMTFVLSALSDRLNLAIEDTQLRVAMPLQAGRLFEAGANVPYDEIIMISNTRRTSGFAGLYVSVLTAYDGRITFPDTAVHELGHSFGVLGDEYQVEGDPCLHAEPEIPLPYNISPTASRDDLKWSHLVEEDTPLPTDNTAIDPGAFVGAYNCEDMYRPAFNCKMRDSDSTFCAVCSEQLVQRMYAFIDPLTHESKATAAREGDELVFTVAAHDQHVGVQWLLDGEEVGTGTELRMHHDNTPQTWTQLTARIHDASGFIVRESPRSETTVNWWVRQ